MPVLLTPARRRGEEILARPGVAPEVVTRALTDVAKTNALFGGTRAALAELERAVPDLPRNATLLDVATGLGDIPRAAAERFSARDGLRLTTIGVDKAEELVVAARPNLGDAICGDALSLPFRSRSVDVVLCSQFLHHLPPDEAIALIREMNRVARIRVVISDLRRSRLAAAGLWIASFPLRFHSVSRHDGVLSVMRGFTAGELESIIAKAVGPGARAVNRAAFRVTAGWRPTAP